ncbi:DUF262 domain-containing protein [Clostridium butyricum]
MEYLIQYMNIFDLTILYPKKLKVNMSVEKEYRNNKKKYLTNTDIFVLTKGKKVFDIIYYDKYFVLEFNSIIEQKINPINIKIYTKSLRCFIIEYEEIVKNIEFYEFYSRYTGENMSDLMQNMDETMINIENVDDEKDSYSDDDLYNINSWGADLSFRELITMYKEDELLKPELQRKYVWTKNEASRFIDSILLGLPVPSIFLAKTSNEKRLIVDGYQRIMTVYDYVEGIFSGDGKNFKLSNSEIINVKWRGKSFLELTPDERTKIKTTTIHAIIFEQKHPNNDTGMYQIFERINTSGKILKPQEIRNCVYSGAFNTLIMNLNKKQVWRSILGNYIEDSRMADVELILRFFAMSFIRDRDEIKQRQINLTKYLNKFMGKMKDISDEESKKFSDIFVRVIQDTYTKLGDKAFRNLTSNHEEEEIFTKRIHPVIFDAVCSAAVYAIENGIDIEENHIIEENYTELLKNATFKEAISTRTTNTDNIKTRIELAAKYLYGIKYEW